MNTYYLVTSIRPVAFPMECIVEKVHINIFDYNHRYIAAGSGVMNVIHRYVVSDLLPSDITALLLVSDSIHFIELDENPHNGAVIRDHSLKYYPSISESAIRKSIAFARNSGAYGNKLR